MATTIVGTAKLDEAQLTKLRKLELELGGWVVALGTTVQISELADERLQRLQALEEEVGLVLLACESSA